MVTKSNVYQNLCTVSDYQIAIGDVTWRLSMRELWTSDEEDLHEPASLQRMCKEIVSAVNMPIPRYLSNSKICQKVPSSKQIFSIQYLNRWIDLSNLFELKALAYMRMYRHIPKEILVWLNMRADSVPLHRRKSRTYQLVDCMRDAKFNNRGKLLQSVVLHLRNKQFTKRNKAGLSVVHLRKYKASIYLEISNISKTEGVKLYSHNRIDKHCDSNTKK